MYECLYLHHMNNLREMVRPYVAIPSKRAIVPTEPGEYEILDAGEGIVDRGSIKIYGAGGAAENAVRFSYGTEEQFQGAIKALKASPASKEKPRSSLAF